MTYATAPAATSGGGSSNIPPVCQNCTTSTTPLWRRDESGSVLCNACGLFLKLHGRPRPISLKTDVIKSRNRVKTAGPGQKRKEVNGTAPSASHPHASLPPGATLDLSKGQKHDSARSEHSNSPLSRTDTPGLHHPSNIAPQHVFDGVSLDHHTFHSPSLPANPFPRQPSPGSASSVNGSHLEPPLSYDALHGANAVLKTRVTELEVINDLFRGRVAELEQSEADARRNEMLAREAESRLRADLDAAHARAADLNRCLEETEAELAECRDAGPRHKRMRLSDIVDESQASTPTSSASNAGA